MANKTPQRRYKRRPDQEVKTVIKDGLEYYFWVDDNGVENLEPGDWADVLKQDGRSNEGYLRLAAAIAENAAKAGDKAFFYSDWFNMLMPHTDGAKLYEQIRENLEKYDTCYAMKEVIDPKTGKRRLTRYYTDVGSRCSTEKEDIYED